MRRKPVNPRAAESEGVDRLLREFSALRTAKPSGTVTAAGSGGGPIESTYLVASSTARDELKAVADFVCDGVDDDLEINAALALADDPDYPGRVMLTLGLFTCGLAIDYSAATLEGSGPGTILFNSTTISPVLNAFVIMEAYGPTLRNLSVWHRHYTSSDQPTAVMLNGTGLIEDVWVSSYDTAVTGENAIQVQRGGMVRNCEIDSVGGGIRVVDFGTFDNASVIGCLLNYCEDYGIRDEGAASVIVGNTLDQIGDNGIEVAGVGGTIVGNAMQDVTGDGVYVTGDNNSIVGNAMNIVSGDGVELTAAADGNVVDGNAFKAVTGSDVNDAGTNTKIGAYVGDIVNQTESVFFGADTPTVGSGASRLYAEVAMTIVDVALGVGGTPSGGACTVDVNIDGTTAFTTQGNRPSVAASSYHDGAAVPDVTAVSAGSYLTVDFDEVNAATDAVVTVRWRKT